ncbi:hypothetical protein BDY19DRAFT_891474 [Irpex rosettiformis]|uniref:Uncharacterized protein n=1 Tax=Irpex rosettiformis TaxID=378272 RepID=A0ACB8U2C8_9APHY|nr:hypothetical protein BDY19DRAFT_891474 [Irpex rosettiformis]
MPPRPSLLPKNGAFYPPNDPYTYRDLLLFEERLKTNATSLNQRKRRYQLFLCQLLLIIAFLLSEVLLQTNFLSIPYSWLLQWMLPDIYGPQAEVRVHRYFALGLLCVSMTTLALFFLSGMYSEKIGYANKYVPHANRALRSFNMYLNVRQLPLRSKLPFNPFGFLFPRTSPSTSPVTSPTSSSPPTLLSGSRRSPSPQRLSKRNSSVPIAPIPPSRNPRGELIFSSRVDRSFRDSYERYRNAFERKREERERAGYEATWLGWITTKVLRIKRPLIFAPAPPGSAGGVGGSGSSTPVPRTGSVRGRGSASVTPSSSRKSSPIPSRANRRTSMRNSLEPTNASSSNMSGGPEATSNALGVCASVVPDASPL